MRKQFLRFLGVFLLVLGFSPLAQAHPVSVSFYVGTPYYGGYIGYGYRSYGYYGGIPFSWAHRLRVPDIKPMLASSPASLAQIAALGEAKKIDYFTSSPIPQNAVETQPLAPAPDVVTQNQAN